MEMPKAFRLRPPLRRELGRLRTEGTAVSGNSCGNWPRVAFGHEAFGCGRMENTQLAPVLAMNPHKLLSMEWQDMSSGEERGSPSVSKPVCEPKPIGPASRRGSRLTFEGVHAGHSLIGFKPSTIRRALLGPVGLFQDC